MPGSGSATPSTRPASNGSAVNTARPAAADLDRTETTNVTTGVVAGLDLWFIGRAATDVTRLIWAVISGVILSGAPTPESVVNAG